MKHLITLVNITIVITFALLGYSCNNSPIENPTVDKSNIKSTINVGVFDGHGGSQTCVWEAVEAVKIDKEMNVRLITTSDIANGCLDSLHATHLSPGIGIWKSDS